MDDGRARALAIRLLPAMLGSREPTLNHAAGRSILRLGKITNRTRSRIDQTDLWWHALEQLDEIAIEWATRPMDVLKGNSPVHVWSLDPGRMPLPDPTFAVEGDRIIVSIRNRWPRCGPMVPPAGVRDCAMMGDVPGEFWHFLKRPKAARRGRPIRVECWTCPGPPLIRLAYRPHPEFVEDGKPPECWVGQCPGCGRIVWTWVDPVLFTTGLIGQPIFTP